MAISIAIVLTLILSPAIIIGSIDLYKGIKKRIKRRKEKKQNKHLRIIELE